MPQRPSRSLKHEYELFVEREIENYKESVPRSVLLSIGDDAVRALADEQQFALTELLLWDEVDRIIFKRLRLPSYATWRKRRIKLLEELRRPEHWGLSPDDFVVRTVQPVAADSRVLVAGVADENRALLYLAAHGCDVTALGNGEDVQRVTECVAVARFLGQRDRALRARRCRRVVRVDLVGARDPAQQHRGDARRRRIQRRERLLVPGARLLPASELVEPAPLVDQRARRRLIRCRIQQLEVRGTCRRAVGGRAHLEGDGGRGGAIGGARVVDARRSMALRQGRLTTDPRYRDVLFGPSGFIRRRCSPIRR